jgi:hypothetical protein
MQEGGEETDAFGSFELCEFSGAVDFDACAKDFNFVRVHGCSHNVALERHASHIKKTRLYMCWRPEFLHFRCV